MGKGGRRPKPTHLKLVQGNPGRRPLNAREPKPRPAMPVPPAHMTDGARQAWGGLARQLNRMGVLTEADGMALERLAECYAEVVACQAAVAANGRTYECVTESGGTLVRGRPEVAMLADADRRFKGYLAEFGLTPAARVRVEAGEPQDELAEFFSA